MLDGRNRLNLDGQLAEAVPEELTDGPSPLNRAGRRASDALLDHLASMILRGELITGNPLPSERELMKRYGVSRSVVRETIIGLAGRGLLKTSPGFRPVVNKPDYDAALDSVGRLVAHLTTDEEGVKNIFESRVFLEASLARWAALNARKDDIRELEERLLRNREAVGVRRIFEATDVAFHDVLYTIPRNPVYPAIHRAYVDWLRKPWSSIERTAEIDLVMYAGHEGIFKAIVDRDPDLAEESLRRHLNTAWEFVRSTFDFQARAGGTARPSVSPSPEPASGQ
ncbi:MAG: FCD domain-containing protein [Verrucomicrobia bacterium]|nr:FCD domain-containing protein [Verrucomicrobiota bacterium]